MEKFNKIGEYLEFAVALLLIGVGVGFRLVPHAPNFTPVAAIALSGGVYFSRKTALILPVMAMLVSDIFIGFYDIKIMAAVYASFLISVFLGFWLKNNKKWHLIAGGAILSSVLFFLVTNFAVFAFSPWYAKSLSGLIHCYAMAVPFFRNTVLGDLFYAAVFFGAYELIIIYAKKIFKIKERVVCT